MMRPIRPEDEPMEGKMLSSISEESNRFRFMGYVPSFDHDSLVRFTHNDYDRELAIIAVVEEKGEAVMAGVVRMISDPWNEVAEYAILVADTYQGMGLGRLLTNFIIEIAAEWGISRLEAQVLNNNRAMLHLLRKNGFRTVDRDFDASQLILELQKNQ